MLPWQKTLLNFHNLEWKNRYFDISLREELFLYWLEWYYWNYIPFIACTYQKEERSLITDIEKARTLWVLANVSPLIAYFAIQAGWDFARVSRWAGRAGGRITGGEDIFFGKNESDVRTGLTSVCHPLPSCSPRIRCPPCYFIPSLPWIPPSHPPCWRRCCLATSYRLSLSNRPASPALFSVSSKSGLAGIEVQSLFHK